MWTRILIALAAIMMVIYTAFYLLAEQSPAFPWQSKHPAFLTIGHQGGYLLWPSNTLYAFEQAEQLGVGMLEMDVHQSQDGHLVVMHDATVDRTTNGSGYLKDKALADIKQLDAGFRWLEDAPDDFPYRGKGITVPTLAEVFSRFPHKLMTIEIKQTEPSIAVSLCRLIHEFNKTDDVIIGSFYQSALDEFRLVCPDVATSMAQSETTWFVILNKLGLAHLTSPRGQALQVPHYSAGMKVVTPSLIDDAHSKGMKVHVWTINDPWEMRELIDMGVDGIISDRPDLLRNTLRKGS